ncbi:hypothetical protein IQ235_01950 [Oscillatoriales cyanobacterium LEGE 11467]|uniref:Uncharacterized protein n=1 Tax=Zarconia navalis LEGE 11467 TaxID=1828826 RepID=A0A928VSG7_9CYAN|nr:hypothetical protein [Zarconia navalis LEGE 11467]
MSELFVIEPKNDQKRSAIEDFGQSDKLLRTDNEYCGLHLTRSPPNLRDISSWATCQT